MVRLRAPFMELRRNGMTSEREPKTLPLSYLAEEEEA
jgi:hypothetical protein